MPSPRAKEVGAYAVAYVVAMAFALLAFALPSSVNDWYFFAVVVPILAAAVLVRPAFGSRLYAFEEWLRQRLAKVASLRLGSIVAFPVALYGIALGLAVGHVELAAKVVLALAGMLALVGAGAHVLSERLRRPRTVLVAT